MRGGIKSDKLTFWKVLTRTCPDYVPSSPMRLSQKAIIELRTWRREASWDTDGLKVCGIICSYCNGQQRKEHVSLELKVCIILHLENVRYLRKGCFFSICMILECFVAFRFNILF